MGRVGYLLPPNPAGAPPANSYRQIPLLPPPRHWSTPHCPPPKQQGVQLGAIIGLIGHRGLVRSVRMQARQFTLQPCLHDRGAGRFRLPPIRPPALVVVRVPWGQFTFGFCVYQSLIVRKKRKTGFPPRTRETYRPYCLSSSPKWVLSYSIRSRLLSSRRTVSVFFGVGEPLRISVHCASYIDFRVRGVMLLLEEGAIKDIETVTTPRPVDSIPRLRVEKRTGLHVKPLLKIK